MPVAPKSLTTGTILLRRKKSPWADRTRKYLMLIDGEEAGRIGNGAELPFDIAAGKHQVQLKIDWGRSRALEIDVSPGGTIVLECRARNPLFALYWITLGRDQYVDLQLA